jgi:hypothetical protein
MPVTVKNCHVFLSYIFTFTFTLLIKNHQFNSHAVKMQFNTSWHGMSKQSEVYQKWHLMTFSYYFYSSTWLGLNLGGLWRQHEKMCLQPCRYRDSFTRNVNEYKKKQQQQEKVSNFQNLLWDLHQYLVSWRTSFSQMDKWLFPKRISSEKAGCPIVC